MKFTETDQIEDDIVNVVDDQLEVGEVCTSCLLCLYLYHVVPLILANIC